MARITYERGTTSLEIKKGFDLQFTYSNCSGDRINARCKTIMDFIDAMESNNCDIPMLDDYNVIAVFFENEVHNQKSFRTVDDLLQHCMEITK